MTIKEAAFKVEDLKVKAWSLSSLLLAISEALIYGGWDAKAYEGAIHTVVLASRELENDADTVTEELFASARSERMPTESKVG